LFEDVKNKWSFIGFSIGWDGLDRKGGMACLYSYGVKELSSCFYGIEINLKQFDPKEEFEIELFKGIKGVVQEIMIEDYFKVPEEFA